MSNHQPSKRPKIVLSWLIGNFGIVIVSLIGFVTTPLLLKEIGNAGLGILRGIESWTGLLSIITISSSISFAQYFAKLRSQKQLYLIHLEHASRYAIKTSIGLMAVWLLIAAPVFNSIADTTQTPLSPEWMIILFLTGVCFLNSVTTAHQVWLRTHEVIAFEPALSISVNVINLAVVYVLLKTKVWPLGARTLGFVVAQSIYCFFMFIKARKFSQKGTSADLQKINYGKLHLQNLYIDSISHLQSQGSLILIGSFLGPVAITRFWLSQKFLDLVKLPVTQIFSSTIQVLVNLSHDRQEAHFKKKLMELNRLVTAAAIWVASINLLFNQVFMHRWIGDGNYSRAVTFWSTVFFLTSPTGWLWGASLRQKPELNKTLRNLNLIYLILTVPLSLLLMKDFNESSLLISNATVWLLFLLPALAHYLGKYYQIGRLDILRSILRPTLFGIVLLGISFSFSSSIKTDSYFELFSFIFMFSIVSGFSVYWIALNRIDRKFISHTISSFINATLNRL